MEYVAVMSCMATEYAKGLPENIEPLFLQPDRSLDGPVSSHPDMIMCALGDKIFVSASYYEENSELLKYLSVRTGCTVTATSSPRGRKYPLDISLNVLVAAHHIFSLTDKTAPEIVSEAEKQCRAAVRIKQGYAACSSLVLDECIISGDPSVRKAAEACGYDVLPIESGSIILDGYEYGFIGGASGVCGSTVYFLGNIMSHPDGRKICGKLRSLGYAEESLSDGSLVDLGGIKFFPAVKF